MEIVIIGAALMIAFFGIGGATKDLLSKKAGHGPHAR